VNVTSSDHARPGPTVIASTDLLPMVNGDDYPDGIIFTTHYEVIGVVLVCRVQVVHAGQRVAVGASMLGHLERLAYAPRIVVIRDELDGRELYYRQAGWFYDRSRHIVAAFERLDVIDFDTEPPTVP
jgi:hypothetical protein